MARLNTTYWGLLKQPDNQKLSSTCEPVIPTLIPIPTKLVKSLKSWKAKSDKTCSLVFPTAGCKPKLDFLDGLKAVAERAKLDKGNFWLHKFRATFATWSLWAGVDLRTVQQWLGHSDMESTMRYLKPSRSQHVRDKVNEIFA